jgi:hypothetical protein
MKVVFDTDTYVATTWGAAKHFKAGVPQEVGDDFGVFCRQQGAKEYKEPVKEEVEAPSKKKVSKKKETAE